MKYVSWSALREFFFFGMKSSERTVQMRTIYQVTASHYCVTATVTSVLRLFRTSVQTAASNDTDGTTDKPVKRVALGRFQVPISLRDLAMLK
jgi:hypothetical protein